MSKTLFKYGDVHWSLPLLFQYEPIIALIYEVLKKYEYQLPECYLFGAPSTIWTGGRPPHIFSEISQEKLIKQMKYVKKYNAVPTFTFSCMDIKKADLKDKYANRILDVAIDYGARFIVYSDLLRDYIKTKSPNSQVVASVIKPAIRFQGQDKIEKPTIEAEADYYNKLLDEYDIVVVRPEFSKNSTKEEFSLIKDISRLEVLINQTCIEECPKMPEHYKLNEGIRTIEKFQENMNKYGQFKCIKNGINSDVFKEKNLCHSEEKVKELVNLGVKHLKLQGRSQGYSISKLLTLLVTQMFNTDEFNYIILYYLLSEKKLQKEIDDFVSYGNT